MIPQEGEQLVGELLRNIGIDEEAESLRDSLVALLASEGVNAAINHLLSNLPSDTNEETRNIIRDSAAAIFTEITQPIEQHPEVLQIFT